MEIGICMATPEAGLAAALASAGCGYYEPAMASAVMAADDQAFGADLTSWTAGPLPPRSANVLLPGDLKVVGEHVDDAALDAYLERACRRAELLGLEVLVFGSGAARRAPDGFPADRALRQFGEALRRAARHAGPGTVIAAEHLCRAETNVANTLAGTAALVRETGEPGLRLVADGYHLAEENEDVSVVRDVAPLLAHVHVCGPGRRPPAPGDEDYLAPLLGALADAGYSGRCSIECRWEDLAAEGPPAVETVVRAAARAGLS
jgi:sugar phosphate isomerase/epimerase